MLIHNISQLITLTPGLQSGDTLGTLNIMANGAVLIQEERIALIGKSDELLNQFPNEIRLDAAGHVVMPGFVDPHTHLVFAGDRSAEFEMRLQGKTYLEILAAGGGILSTVRASRRAS